MSWLARFFVRWLGTMVHDLRRTYHCGFKAAVSRPFIAIGCVLSLGFLAGVSVAAETRNDDGVFARVGDKVITERVFAEAFSRAMRRRYYHGRPPEQEMHAFRREVAEDLVKRILLLQEARAQGLEPDKNNVEAALDEYDKRYAHTPRWQREGGRLLAGLKPRLEEDDLLRQLEARVRQVAPPSDDELQHYYEANPDKFTEPARDRVSVVLLQVDPSAGTGAWEAARREAADLVTRLRAGADFAELARLHSGDTSAENGGDMGYLHQGMLSPQAEEAIVRLSVGQISEPVKVLEGVAVFKLSERQNAHLNSLSAVHDRARELWMREQSDAAWRALHERLRATTPIEFRDPALNSGGNAANASAHGRLSDVPLLVMR